jgi:membrane fusion protein YbhG
MKRSTFVIIVITATVVLGTGYSLWNYAGTEEPLVISGVVEADNVHVGSKIGGRVLKVVAREGETVNAGEPLVLLEPHDLDAALAEAQAMLHQTEAKYSQVSAGYRKEEIEQAEAAAKQAQAELDHLISAPRRQELEQAKADWTAAKAQAENARKSLKQAEEWAGRNLISRRERDEAMAKQAEAARVVNSARERYESLSAGTRPEEIERVKQKWAEADAKLRQLRAGYRKEEVAQAKSAMEAAQAKAQWIQTQLDETVIKAPVDALVEKLDLAPGDLVSAGKPMATLVPTGSLWVRAYIPQAQLRFIHLGAATRVSVDAYPDEDFAGVVRRIHRQGEFAPGKTLTREERALQVFQTDVAIADPDRVLRPGMNADVTIPRTVQRADAQVPQQPRAD